MFVIIIVFIIIIIIIIIDDVVVVGLTHNLSIHTSRSIVNPQVELDRANNNNNNNYYYNNNIINNNPLTPLFSASLQQRESFCAFKFNCCRRSTNRVVVDNNNNNNGNGVKRFICRDCKLNDICIVWLYLFNCCYCCFERNNF